MNPVPWPSYLKAELGESRLRKWQCREWPETLEVVTNWFPVYQAQLLWEPHSAEALELNYTHYSVRKLISSLPVQPLPVQYSGQAQKSGARHEWDLGHPGQVAAGSSFVLENNTWFNTKEAAIAVGGNWLLTQTNCWNNILATWMRMQKDIVCNKKECLRKHSSPASWYPSQQPGSWWYTVRVRYRSCDL